ncbi:hypothetical protein MAR_024963 [Mya arenaria]|uniref:HAT C-terminal dimerisation domain-containing protein n=1 Tax=Mya arenaria TaxID=6604 RepID=A0ABY7DV73_MYAAR|nr:hypothetical protein MAR_024963 [Mya arenaria]
MYSYNERNGVQSLINVIEPFKNTTEMLSSDKIPTHGLILPALKKLNLVLTVSENDSQMFREVKIVMKGQLDNRTTDTDIDSIGKQQSADPPLPNMNFDEDPETNDVICADEPTQPKKIKLEAPKQDVSKTEPISWLDDIIFVKETKALDLTKLAKKEMDCYLSEPSVDPRYPALSWWKQNESKYPKLSILAKKNNSQLQNN